MVSLALRYIKGNNIILFLIAFVSLLSCNNPKKKLGDFIIDNDSIKIIMKHINDGDYYDSEWYWKSSNILGLKYKSDRLLRKIGYYYEYYPNGKVEVVGNYKNNKKNGKFFYFDENEKIYKLIQWIDSIYLFENEYLNQIYYFDQENNGKINLEKSLFYTIDKKSDTIFDNFYEIKIRLFGGRYKETGLSLNEGYNKYYKVVDSTFEGEGLYVKNKMITLKKVKNIKKGMNYIRGIIFNYKTDKNENLKEYTKTYFVDSFYKI